MEEKNKKVMIIVIITIFVVIISYGGLIVYKMNNEKNAAQKTKESDNNSNSQNDSATKKDSVEEIVEGDSVVTELMKYTGNYTLDRIYLDTAYKILYSNNITNISQIPDVDKFTMAIRKINKEVIYQEAPKISNQEMKSSIESIFGVGSYDKLNKFILNSEQQDELITGCTSAGYVWYANREEYVASHECGGLIPQEMRTKFIKAQKISNENETKIEIDLAVYFIDDRELGKVYSDIKIVDYEVHLENNIGSTIDVTKLKKYRHTFVLDEKNNYIYKTVEMLQS